MAILGAEPCLLDYGDAIYRRDLYLSDDDLFGPVKPEDAETRLKVSQSILDLARETGAERVFLPLGVGGHVDHRLCHDFSAELNAANYPVYFYEDFPYAATAGALERRLIEDGLALESEEVDVSEVIDRRIAAIAAYAESGTNDLSQTWSIREGVASLRRCPEYLREHLRRAILANRLTLRCMAQTWVQSSSDGHRGGPETAWLSPERIGRDFTGIGRSNHSAVGAV